MNEEKELAHLKAPSDDSEQLVERLRRVHAEVVESDGGECEYTALHREAADEIERLRAEIELLRAALAYYADPENDVSIDSGATARKALEGKDAS